MWMTHFLGLVVQTGVAVYIFFMAWRGSYLSILTLPKFSLHSHPAKVFGRNNQIWGEDMGSSVS
jgi:hypothetical protein